MDTYLSIGREFASYGEFQQFLEAREELGERWKISNCKTYSAYNKMIDNPSLHVPDKLKYKEVEFKCIHGRESRTSESAKFRKT